MYRIRYIIFLLIACPLIVKAQTHLVKATPVLRFLYQYNQQIVSITNTKDYDIFDISILNHKQDYKKIIKTGTGLYVIFDGTGQIFKATKLINDQIEFTRIDSTWQFGDNYVAINFHFHDTIYSFGGYGFWHLNGQLRHFSLSDHEWFIDKINALYNTDEFCYHLALDKPFLNPNVYYITGPYNKEEVNSIDNSYTVMQFDVKRRENSVLGKFNDNIKLKDVPFIDITHLNGTLINSLRNYYLLVYDKNEVYKLDNNKLIDLFNNTDIRISFSINNKLYYTTATDPQLRNIEITLKDFKKEPYSIYHSEKLEPQYWYLTFVNDWYIFIGLGILIIAGFSFYKKSKRSNKNNAPPTIHTDLSQEGSNNNSFNELEKIIIEKIIEKTRENNIFTVDEMNLHLGIKRKTIEIQKKVRNESINRINHKFNVLFDMDTTFIERIRSIEDRRFFNYIINAENAHIYFKQKSPAEG
jgi:hypothetical protein